MFLLKVLFMVSPFVKYLPFHLSIAIKSIKIINCIFIFRVTVVLTVTCVESPVRMSLTGSLLFSWLDLYLVCVTTLTGMFCRWQRGKMYKAVFFFKGLPIVERQLRSRPNRYLIILCILFVHCSTIICLLKKFF